jgi:hypothetical protein
MLEEIIRMFVREEVAKALKELRSEPPPPVIGEYLRPHQVQEFYGITKTNLANLRYQGIGPAYSKAGRSINYKRTDIEDYLKAHKIKTASQRN